MANYKYEKGKYYRQSLKGDWFEVNRNEDGYLAWVLPDGRRVYDNTFKVPVMMLTHESPKGGVYYTIPIGGNGSIGHYFSFQDAVNAYTKALDSGAFSDPSENMLNDAMALGGGTYQKLGLKGMGNIVKATTKNAWNVSKKLLTGRVTKEAAKQALKTALKEVPKVGISIAAGKGVDKVSLKLTGNTWGENISDALTKHWGFKVPTIVGDFTNPGNYLGYDYGKFITNNYSNLGRYTLDNLSPKGYSLEQVPSALKGYMLVFYKKPPTFYTHRPKWYKESSDIEYREARLENGANWAGIPESEIPRKYFIRKENGIVEPTLLNKSGVDAIPEFDYKGLEIIFPDLITPGEVGGAHSNYIYLGDDAWRNKAVLFRDKQVLNPQWIVSDWIKKKYHLKEGSPMYNLIHKLGGINLSRVLGYKPFTIEAGIGFPANGGKGQQIDLKALENVELH